MEEESVARFHLDVEVLAAKLLRHLHLVRVGPRLLPHQEVVNSAQLVASCQHLKSTLIPDVNKVLDVWLYLLYWWLILKLGIAVGLKTWFCDWS